MPSYCAAKAGLVHLTHVLAMELARHRILVNALAPGYIETDFNREFLASEAGKKLDGADPVAPRRPAGRSRRRDAAAGLAGGSLYHRRGHRGRWRTRASPRSESPAGVAGEDGTAALARFLAAASGATGLRNHRAGAAFSGGAIQENWGIDARFSGGRLDGEQRLVLRAAGATGVPSSLDRLQEFAVLQAAFAAGVTVPEPLFASADPAVFGKPFFIMRRASGTAAAHRITRDPALDPVLPANRRAARPRARPYPHDPAAARPISVFCDPMRQSGPAQQIAEFRAYLDTPSGAAPGAGVGHPLARNPLACRRSQPVLCHHDFRTGNYLLDGARLTGILDWEFAGWGDPHEDIGWFCCKGWRFARLDREAGGIADRAPFYRGYENESGAVIDPRRVRFWEVLASVRWAVIALAAKRPSHAGRRTQPRSRADRPPRERMRAGDIDAARPRV